MTAIFKRKNKFIERAKIIHGDKYDYSKVDYINTHTKIIIICKKHGEFGQTPHHHKRGQGCPKCQYTYKLTLNDFIEKAVKVHGNTYNYSKVNYINFETKVIIICKIHGEFSQTPHHHNSGQGCPKCKPIKISEKSRLTLDVFIEDAVKVHGGTYDYSKVDYIKSDIKIIIGCKIHGDFEQAPSHHKKGQGCPKCKINYRKK